MLAKHALETTFEQTLQLTPAMMVSLKILAMNGSQLQDYMQEELLSNPMLEWDEPANSHAYDALSDTQLESCIQPTTLQDTLYEQLRFSLATDEVKRVVQFMIDSLDERGYLDSSDGEIASYLQCQLSTIQEAKSVLQEMDPPGIGASNLLECLMLQLDRYPQNDTVLLAQKMIQGVLTTGSMSSRFMTTLRQGCDEQLWCDALTLLRHLEFRPGWDGHSLLAKMQPDVVVRRIHGEYIVSLNEKYMRNVKFSDMMQDTRKDTDHTVNEYIRERTFAAKTLLRSIDSRNQTLLTVAKEILRRQSDFLTYGVSRLCPLSVHSIAQALSLHDSTVSRAISGKTVVTPQGSVALRFLITGRVTEKAGIGVSMHEVSFRIQELISEETVEHPLSDQDIVSALQRFGLGVSRRTVTKYRLQLKIPCAAKRKLARVVKT